MRATLLLFAVSAMLSICQGHAMHDNGTYNGAYTWPNISAIAYTTFVTDFYTTYCPSATILTQGGNLYTVTEVSDLFSSYTTASNDAWIKTDGMLGINI